MQPLQQGRLPDINEVTNGAQNTVRDLTDNLMRLPSTLGNTLNQGNQGAQGGQGGLGNLLGQYGGQPYGA